MQSFLTKDLMTLDVENWYEIVWGIYDALVPMIAAFLPLSLRSCGSSALQKEAEILIFGARSIKIIKLSLEMEDRKRVPSNCLQTLAPLKAFV